MPKQVRRKKLFARLYMQHAPTEAHPTVWLFRRMRRFSLLPMRTTTTSPCLIFRNAESQSRLASSLLVGTRPVFDLQIRVNKFWLPTARGSHLAITRKVRILCENLLHRFASTSADCSKGRSVLFRPHRLLKWFDSPRTPMPFRHCVRTNNPTCSRWQRIPPSQVVSVMPVQLNIAFTSLKKIEPTIKSSVTLPKEMGMPIFAYFLSW